MLALLVAGCSATMVNPPGGATGSPYAPVNEGQRPGVVSFLNQGLPDLVQARREDAYKQMFTACGGAYRIDREGAVASGGSAIPLGGGVTTWRENHYWSIQFSCMQTPEPRPTAAPAPAPRAANKCEAGWYTTSRGYCCPLGYDDAGNGTCNPSRTLAGSAPTTIPVAQH
jgi:hypothetical protein